MMLTINLLGVLFAYNFSNSVGYLITQLIVSFNVQKFLILMRFSCLFVAVLLLPVPLVSYPGNHCQIQCYETFAPCFLPRVL